MASPKRKRSAVVRIAGEKRVANDREKKFAREYLKCFNFYKAAKAAGFAETTARRTAYMIFSRPWVPGVCRRTSSKIRIRRHCRSQRSNPQLHRPNAGQGQRNNRIQKVRFKKESRNRANGKDIYRRLYHGKHAYKSR